MSNLSLERLLFDPANVADGPLVGSYLIGGTSNTPIGDTVAGVLDVNITNPLTVDVALDGFYVPVTNATPDSVGLIGFTRAATPAITDQIERMTVGVPADAVVNANVHGLDVNGFMMGFNGTTWDRLTSTSGALDVNITNAISVTGNVADDAADSGNPLKVGSRAVSGLLTAVSATNDRADLLSDLYRRIWVNNAPNVGVSHGVQTIGTTEVAITTLAGMTRALLQNVSDRSIFIGATGVTVSGATRGLEISKGGTLAIECGPNIPLFAITSAAGKDLVVLRLA